MLLTSILLQRKKTTQKWLTLYWNTAAVFQHNNFHEKNDFKFHKIV